MSDRPEDFPSIKPWWPEATEASIYDFTCWVSALPLDERMYVLDHLRRHAAEGRACWERNHQGIEDQLAAAHVALADATMKVSRYEAFLAKHDLLPDE